MAPRRSIKCVSNQCKAILNGKTRLTTQQRRLLTPHKRALRTLANPRTSVRSKRKLLNQKGGFLAMKFTRKMRLVPADEPEKIVTVKPYGAVYDQNPVKEALEELSQEMQRLLKSNTSDDIKMDQYGQMLHRYRILQNKRHARTIPETTNNKHDDIASVEKP
ncbi:hypothetical protein LOTGIDRAFT_175922 [Lottia gigantea]|uniref:Uncharacterized protein n=1 Tax=Lottia gigantea TaxID=225164 RepID=V3ZAQ9_LOTGI|nr:hypothetical protein LOTGIDRAFT_175922 [Lottia gigantea]ESO88068.1 hypothetical protein LOTGIDRAFT_175922 [Lottia gigantea]